MHRKIIPFGLLYFVPGRVATFNDVILAKRARGVDVKPFVNASAMEMMAAGELTQLDPIIIC